MLKKTLTYKDFEDRDVTETFYFNLTQTELISVALGLPDVDETTATTDVRTVGVKLLEKLGGEGVFDFIKDLVAKSYGVKSADGKRFIKTPEQTEEFKQTLAYDTIVMELLNDDNAASEFVNHIIPASVLEKMIEKRNAQQSTSN